MQLKSVFKLIAIIFLTQIIITQTISAQINLFPPIESQLSNKKILNTKKLPDIKVPSLKKQNNFIIEENTQAVKTPKKKRKSVSVSKAPSIIERMFGGKLQQFGYELFDKATITTQGAAISKDYRLNIGDRVRIYFWGETFDFMAITGAATLEPMVNSVVDREGNLFIPNVGVIQAEGRTIAEVERNIYLELSKNYTNFEVKITVSEPRDFPVLVMGKVKYPGTVYISSTANFLDALNFAGGIEKNGSLRNIIHIDKETKKKTKIDLYKLLVEGNYDFIDLSSGDVILVNPIGNVVALAEGVKRPAIYEFSEGETLKNILHFAGGLLPTVDIHSLQLESFDQSTNEKQLKSVTLSELKVLKPQDGDLLKFKSVYEVAENTVKLIGNIKHPGEFQYREGMRLSDIISGQDELLIRTYTNQAVIERITGVDREVTTIPISLTAFFNGSIDPELCPMDVIKIYASTKMPMIEVAGQVVNPGLIPYKEKMTLSDVLSVVRINENVNNIVVEISNPLINKSNGTSEDNLILHDAPDKIFARGLEEYKINLNQRNLNLNQLQNKLEERITTVYLYDLLTNTTKSKEIKIFPDDTLLFRLVTDKEALKTVKIMGYVKNPGIYKIKPGMKLTDLIKQAGGLTKNAYLNGMVFLRSSVDSAQEKALTYSSLDLQEEIISAYLKAQSLAGEQDLSQSSQFLSIQQGLLTITQRKARQKLGRVIIDIKSNDLNSLSESNDLELQDGDQIIIPQSPSYVVVIGEVYNQAAIAYYPGHDANFYINKVGGPTKRAKKRNIFILKANGSVIKPKKLSNATLDPGDSIIVPRKVKLPINIRGIIKDLAQIGASAAQTLFILDRL